MDLEKINRRHFMETDMYYRVGYGLSSKLLEYNNGVFILEVVIGRKWTKPYNETAHELAYCWKDSHSELSHALACKVYIIDAKRNRYKQSLLKMEINPGYDAKKGIMFVDSYLN